MRTIFDHEKLTGYEEAIRFVAWTDEILEGIPKSLAVHGQLDRAACLDVLVAKQRLTEAGQGKESLLQIVSMLVGLIRSTSPDRVYEEGGAYGADGRE